jgi:epoxyqueuosine reductase
LKDAIPTEVKEKFENWAFGCDICQEVCPWNRFSHPHQEPDFRPEPELMNMTLSDWNEVTEEVFNRLFEHSAVQRAGFDGLKRNLEFLK